MKPTRQLGHAVASYIFVTDRILVHSTRGQETRIAGEAYITVTRWLLMR